MHDHTQLPPAALSLGRMAVRLVLLGLLLFVLYRTMGAIMVEDAVAEATGREMRYGLLFLTLGLYAILLAIPFVPGVEIGIGLLILGGAVVAPYVYAATVLGLVLAFLIGQALSHEALRNLVADLRMRRLCGVLDEVLPLSRQERLALLRRKLPSWARPLAGSSRYVLIGCLIALPGSALIGGGGGICLIAGVSRLFSAPAMILTIVLAVAPVPLAIWMFDLDVAAYL